MNISLNWLREYVSLSNSIEPEEFAEKLTMSTVEVEKFHKLNENLDNIVVGQIKEIVKHPKADKLAICQVDIGKDKYLPIVCGGRNIYEGMKVIVALVGSKVLWHGEEWQELKKAKIRGVESEGMICGPSEIGLKNYFPQEDDIANLKDYKAKLGTPVAEAMDLDDVIIEIDNKSLTNRPDLWGHYGIAREVAAIYNLKLKEIEQVKIKTENQADLKINIASKDDCPRYLGIILDNITIKDSPNWLKKRLLAIGQRPINNVVDVTNFIMHELGQPLHAFDADKIKDLEINVKRAKKNQKFNTLDGENRKLSENILTICDKERPVALAGIMGGKETEINQGTKRILIESANFEPTLIRKASVEISLRTDASSRFEKGLDPELANTAINRAVKLIQDISPECQASSKLVDAGEYKPVNKTVELDSSFISKRLGKELTTKKIIEILESLYFQVKSKKDKLTVTIPSFRAGKDITIAEDLVEEVGRIYGYNNIEPQNPLVHMTPPDFNWELKQERSLRYYIVNALGFYEVYNYSMISTEDIEKMKLRVEDHFRLKSYSSVEQTHLRTNLIVSLLKNCQQNLKYFDHFRLYELARIFKKKPGELWRNPDKDVALPQQQKHLAGVVIGERNNFLTAKGSVHNILEKMNLNFRLEKDDNYHPWAASDKTLKVIVNEHILGAVGEIDKQILAGFDIDKTVAFFNLNFTKLSKISGVEKQYKPIEKFPSVVQDLSIVVDDNLPWGDIEKEILSQSNLITEVELFDIYQHESLGKDKKSLAFHIVFYHPERTLVSNEVDKEMQKIITVLESKFSALIRKAN